MPPTTVDGLTDGRQTEFQFHELWMLISKATMSEALYVVFISSVARASWSNVTGSFTVPF